MNDLDNSPFNPAFDSGISDEDRELSREEAEDEATETLMETLRNN
jgi:hypothetical protein